ncbi:MAG TPA: HPF/RaiA family ribosome-associated protein [Candidatus Binataceae bacterium]|jgi:ribosome-associated translation inhibitor RaiA
MQTELQITARNFTLNETIEAEIRTKVAKLGHLYDRISGCHVVVEGAVGHHHRGGPFDVRSHGSGRRFEYQPSSAGRPCGPIREAFEAARRKLEDHVHRQRGE